MFCQVLRRYVSHTCPAQPHHHHHRHAHAYERSQPVYNNKVDNCGPAHITIGDGGNVEGLLIDFIDSPGVCSISNMTMAAPPYQPQKCVSYWGPNGTFCPTSQPAFSAFREPSFGYGVLEVHNATTATWQWHNNEVRGWKKWNVVPVVCAPPMYINHRNPTSAWLTRWYTSATSATSVCANVLGSLPHKGLESLHQ